MSLIAMFSNNVSLLSPQTDAQLDECAEEDAECDKMYKPYNERPETYIIPIIFSIIFVVGVVGNGTLIIIFIRHRSMRNIPNT